MLAMSSLTGATANSRDLNVMAPILGNYPKTSVSLSGDRTVTPDSAPTNTTSINVSTSTAFKGKLEGYPATGIVRVTDAHPAGTYRVAVRAFDSGGASVTKSFMLRVRTPATCNPVHFAAATNVTAGNGPYASAVGDFNGDGKQDLAVTNISTNSVSILLGNGNGTFGAPATFPVGSTPTSVAVGDFNGDGKQDLAVANLGSNTAGIYLGNGVGGFTLSVNVRVGDGPYSVTVGDFNGDGKPDIATANFSSSNVSIVLGDGTVHFGAAGKLPVGSAPRLVAIGDFNGDRNQDLAVANTVTNFVSMFLGDGNGGFGTATILGVGPNPYSAIVGDFNGDGKQDIATANNDLPNPGSVSIMMRDCAL